MATDRAPALTEGLRIVELVARSPTPVPFERILQQVTMSRSSVNRLLKVLTANGYLRPATESSRGYVTAHAFLALVHASRQTLDRSEQLRGLLDGIAAETNTSVQLAVLDAENAAINVIARALTEDSINVSGAGYDLTQVAHRHGLGKLVLALAPPRCRKSLLTNVKWQARTPSTLMTTPELDDELTKIVQEEHAVEREECTPGVFRVAVPIHDRNGQFFGGLSAAWLGIGGEQEQQIDALRERLQLAGREVQVLFELT